MQLTPAAYYQQQLAAGIIVADVQQAEVVTYLESVYQRLVLQQVSRQRWGFKKKPVKGLYLWGPVGTGKTWLLDCFYACYPYAKQRLHFHAFLDSLHADLRARQGQPSPLRGIAKKIAAETSVLCFDEFFVNDIGDAMLLGELLQCLFAEGMCLIATSNVAPDDLYREGLQRERFLPTIEAIKNNTHVYVLSSDRDYRTNRLKRGAYWNRLEPATTQSMQALFQEWVLQENKENKVEIIPAGEIMLLGRTVLAEQRTDKIIWFRFSMICGVPRSQRDYLELVKHYHTVFISDVPIFDAKNRRFLTAFIHLIDVLYDAQVRCAISAAAPVTALYVGHPPVAVRRMQSRLQELFCMA